MRKEARADVRAEAKARAESRGAKILTSEFKSKTKYRVLIPKPDGSYQEKIFDSHKRAVAHVKVEEKAQVMGIDLDLAKETLSSVAERWRVGASIDWGPANAAQVESFLSAHILPKFGSTVVGSIRHSDVQEFYVGMRRAGAGDVYQVTLPDGTSAERVFRSVADAKAWQENRKGRVLGSSRPKGLPYSTARRVVRLLDRLLETSVRDGALNRNPCSGIDFGKDQGPSRVGLWLERPAVHAVAQAIPERYQVAVLTAHGAALRFQEMAGLRRDRILAPGVRSQGKKVVSLVDVDSSWRIRVDSVLIEVHGRLEEKSTPKTEAGLREVPMAVWLAEALLAHCDRFEVGETDLVFTTSKGAPLRRGNFSKRVLYRVSEGVLGQRVHTHDLRRSGISQWIADGIRPEVAQVWAGHADLRTTMGIYHSVFPSTEAEAVARLEEANSGVVLDLGWSRFGPEDGSAQSEVV